MEKIKNGKVFVWMQMLGFDRNDKDLGASRFLEQTGFLPDGVCALLFHPDFIHQHKGMDYEYELPADMCSYFGIPYNKERERQPWSNYNLRELARNLADQGVGMYPSIMSIILGDVYHREWINDYPEIQRYSLNGASHHCPLKRFADGSWYEDFFIDKLCDVLIEYGFKGIHLADGFCPNLNIFNGDYSTDMITQFVDYSGMSLPADITKNLGNDDPKIVGVRDNWIWKNARPQWIEFMCWRWEQFFEKLCKRVHEINCEVMVLGMYCTDPFETKYCLGMDIARVLKAGIDYLTANILPTSCFIGNTVGSNEDRFHRYMAIAPTTAAHIRHGHLVSMLGVQDASEEWDAMKHVPCMHERDIYTMMSYQIVDRNGLRRALEGYFICLGDGIPREDWDWERERLEIALSEEVIGMISPAMLWSDVAYENMLGEYICTRRWTPYKLFYEMGKAGTMLAGCVRMDGLERYEGTLLVPDFDLLSYEEQVQIANYSNGSVVGTIMGEFNPKDYGISPSIVFTDSFCKRPLTVFAFGKPISIETRKKLDELLSIDDEMADIEGDPAYTQEFTFTLVDTLPFTKVSTGMCRALALVLSEISQEYVSCDKPYLAFRLKNGAIRIYIFNDTNYHYRHAFVKIEELVVETRIVSKFPVLPVRYISEKSNKLTHLYTDDEVSKQHFEVKLPPGGVTIVDVFTE